MNSDAVCNVSMPPNMFGRLTVGFLERRVIECAIAWVTGDEQNDAEIEKDMDNLWAAVTGLLKAREQLAKDDAAAPHRTLDEVLR